MASRGSSANLHRAACQAHVRGMSDLSERIERLRPRRAARLARANALFCRGDDFLMRIAADDMAERVGLVARRFERACALFGRTSHLADRLAELRNVAGVERVEEGAATPDALNLSPGAFDLICAPLTLHQAVDLPGALVQAARALEPDGLLLAALPGPRTLHELREVLLSADIEASGGAAQRVDLFAEVRDAGALLQRAGLALPVTDTDLHVVRYDGLSDLVRDLRRMASTFVEPVFGSRQVFDRAVEIYRERFADEDGRIRATFEIVSMSGWAPHPSQQKPLRPGSAKARLADALGVPEKPA